MGEEGSKFTSRYVLYCTCTGFVQDIQGKDGEDTLKRARASLKGLQIQGDQLDWWKIAVEVKDPLTGEAELDFFTPLDWDDALILRQLNDPPREE